MRTLTKFKGDALQASKDTVQIKSQNVTDVCMLGGGGGKLLQNSATFWGYILVRLPRIMFKLGIFTNFFKSFSAALMDFC